MFPKGLPHETRQRKKNDGEESRKRVRDGNLKGANVDPARSPRVFVWLIAAVLGASLTPGTSGEGHNVSQDIPYLTRSVPLELDEEALKNLTCWKQCAERKEQELLPPGLLLQFAFAKSQCYCDEGCHIFGDCCPDLLKTDAESSFELVPLAGKGAKEFMGLPVHRWGCHEVKRNSRGVEYKAYLVDSCPDDYWDPDVVTMCSRRHQIPVEEYSFVLDLPVISSRTGIPYLNFFCMACNERERDGDDPPFYKMELKYVCSDEQVKEEHGDQEPVYIKGRREWIQDGQNCTLEIVDAEKVFFGAGKDLDRNRPGQYTRRCVETESTCKDEKLSEFCSKYALHVHAETSRGVKFFKNPHCALCHGKHRDELSCVVKTKFIPTVKFKPPKMKTLFEIKWDGSAGRCPALQMWYAVEEKYCCQKGEKLTGGRCKAKVEKTSEVLPWNLTSGGDRNFSGTDPGGSGEGGNWTSADSTPIDDIQTLIQTYMMLACMSISIICLIIHIIIYSFLPKLRNLPGRNLLALSWALLLAQSIALISGIEVEGPAALWFCFSAAVVIHYFYMAAFFWMNVMSVDVWRTFSASSSRHHGAGSRDYPRRLHLRYSAYAWGLPLMLIALGVALDLVPASPDSSLSKVRPAYGMTKEMCWLSNSVGAAIFFTVPTIVLLLSNAGLFARSVFKIHQNQESRRYMRKKAMEEETLCNQRVSRATESEARSSTGEVTGIVPVRPFRRPETTTSCISGKDKSRLYLYVKLATIMGLSWICMFIAELADIKELWYPFILLNGLQGAFIFFMFDVKWKVMGMLAERITGKKPDWVNSSSSSSKWPIFRNTLSFGRRGRKRKSSEYAVSDLGNFAMPKKKEGGSSRTTSSSMPNSSDAEICNRPEGPCPANYQEIDGTENLKVTENVVTSTPINGISRAPSLHLRLQDDP